MWREKMDWETFKMVLVVIAGGVLWLLGWLFGKKKTQPTTDEKAKEKVQAAEVAIAKIEGGVEVKENLVDGKLEAAEAQAAKAEALLQEANRIRDEITASKQAESDALKAIEAENERIKKMEIDALNKEFEDKGY